MSLKTFPFVSVLARVANCIWSYSRNPREYLNVQSGADKMATILETEGWRDNAVIDAVKMPVALARELLGHRLGVQISDLETAGYFEPDEKGNVFLCCTAHTRKRALDIIRGRNPGKFAELFKALPLRVFEVPLPAGEGDMKRFEGDLQRVYQDEMAADPSKRPLDAVERYHQIVGYLELGWTEKEVASRIFGTAGADEEKGSKRSPIQMAKRVEALAKLIPDFLPKWTAYKRNVENAVAITDDLIKGDSQKQIVGLHQVLVAEREEMGVSAFGPDNCPRLKARWQEVLSGAGKKVDKKPAGRGDMEKLIEGSAASEVKSLIGDLSGDAKTSVDRKRVLYNAAMREQFSAAYPELYEGFVKEGGKRIDPVTVYPDLAAKAKIGEMETEIATLRGELEALKNAAPKGAGAAKKATVGK